MQILKSVFLSFSKNWLIFWILRHILRRYLVSSLGAWWISHFGCLVYSLALMPYVLIRKNKVRLTRKTLALVLL